MPGKAKRGERLPREPAGNTPRVFDATGGARRGKPDVAAVVGRWARAVRGLPGVVGAGAVEGLAVWSRGSGWETLMVRLSRRGGGSDRGPWCGLQCDAMAHIGNRGYDTHT